MPADKPTELSRIKLKNLNSTARSYDQQAFSPPDPTAIWHSHLALAIYIFVTVNFNALAQASDFRIERRQVVFLCWMQDSNPEGLWNPIFSRPHTHTRRRARAHTHTHTSNPRPHDAAYCLLTHHWQVHEIIFPPYLAYIRRNCLGMDVNNLELILVQVMTCHCQTAYSNKLKQTEQDILNPSAEILVIWLFYSGWFWLIFVVTLTLNFQGQI